MRLPQSSRVRFLIGASVVAAIVLAVVWFFTRPDDAQLVDGLTPAGPVPFDDDGALPPGPSRAVFSPDGTRLVVLANGRIDLALEGDFVPVTPHGGNVVDTAWFGAGEVVLVAEGPAPTGGLAVVEIDGTVRGTIPLARNLEFGSGYGMAVAPGDREAVVTAVVRPALEPLQRHLVIVDLETGEVRDLTPAGGPDEYDPRYLDDGRVVFTDGDGGAHVVDPRNRDVDAIADSRILGVIDGTYAVVAAGGDLVAFVPGEEPEEGHVLGTVPDDAAAVVDVDPSGTRALVLEGTPQHLRTVRLRPPASR